MYSRILVPLENSRTDACIMVHVRSLATHCRARVLLIHVADGFVARNFKQLELRESEEMRKDREYLDRICSELRDEGFACDAILASGDPAAEIAAAADREQCDLIAMGTHGHKLLADLVYGSVASAVRHLSTVPVLLVRDLTQAGAKPAPA